MNFKIRKISVADKPELLDIMTDFYNSPALLHHTPRAVLERVVDDCISDLPFLEGYVAVSDDNDVLGYTLISIGYSTEYGGINIMTEDLYVVPAARGHGVGKALLDFTENKYKDIAVRFRLEVVPDNTGAIKLYERCGYSEITYKQMGKTLS